VSFKFEDSSLKFLTPKTARNYVSRIFGKLNVHTRTEAALVYARHSGLIAEDAGQG
jgi:DNA-binding NarL/FixJ family response regulator